MKKTFYVTTPIYYPSGNLHIGHCYTTTLADIMNRFKKEMGFETFFLTGSDEHGQKIEEKSLEANLTPKEYVDKIIINFKKLWTILDINYDKFIRTTDEFHMTAVQKIFTILYEKGLIYPSEYRGKYCISCEEFLNKEQMDENFVHNVCLKKANDFSEETYMLRVSEFKSYLLELFETGFLEPESRKKEMVNNFIENDLEDLSVTRISFSWGIKIKQNPKHIVYVWIDALSNYITALGYGSDNETLLKKFWSDETEILQFIGKEITRFHSIYWPVILKGLNLRTPTKLLSHGWILSNSNKMSKSIGNVVDPIELIEKYSSDALRFYIANELPTDRDGNYSEELFIESYNNNLANNIGNLISRVSNMIIKYFDGKLNEIDILNHKLFMESQTAIEKYIILMNEYKISEATKIILNLGQLCNKFIEETAPWNLEKENKISELNLLLFALRYSIAVINFLLKPILTKSINDMFEQIGLNLNEANLENIKTNNLKYKKIIDKKILFERIK